MTQLGTDVMSARTQVDWVAKLALLEGYRQRDGLAWDDPRLAAIDLQWSDVRPARVWPGGWRSAARWSG